MAHMPTPWQVAEIDGDYSIHTVHHHPQLKGPAPVVTTSVGPNICRLYLTKDNATFIVEACNGHDALVAALQAVYRDIELQNVPGGSDELNLMVQAALERVEGER